MKKIGLIIDYEPDKHTLSGKLALLKENLSPLGGELHFFGRASGGSIRPLNEAESFPGILIDLRNPEINVEDSKRLRIAVDIRSASIWHHMQQGIGHNIREQLNALRNQIDKIDLTLFYDEEIGVSDDIRAMEYKLKPVEEFKAEEFDLLHLTDPMSEREKLPLLPFDPGKLPLIANFYDVIPAIFDEMYFTEEPEKRPGYYRRAAEVRETVDRFITISETSKRGLNEYFGVDKDKIEVMSAGVNRRFFENRDFKLDENIEPLIDPGKPWILYVGSHDYRKRIDLLFKAFNLIHNRLKGEIQLLLAGFYVPDFEKSLQDMGADPDTIKDIKTLRYIPEESLIYFYKNASALVHPSLYEGFGLPLVEAMAAGCPVVAFNNSAIAEIAQEAAVLVQNGNHRALAEEALHLIQDEDHRREMIEKGLARAKTYTWERVADKTVKAYFNLLKKETSITEKPKAINTSAPKILPAEIEDFIAESHHAQDLKVTIEGVFLDKSGYALHSRHMALGLDKLGADVNLNICWFAGAPDIEEVAPDAPKEEDAVYLTQENGRLLKYKTPVESDEAKRILELSQKKVNPSGRTLVANLPADSPKDPIYKRIRETHPGFAKYIGYTMFEMADIPRGWVEGCGYMDEIWLPSNFNKESFVRCGVPEEKIKLVPLGVDAEKFHPDKALPLQIPGVKGFNFLSVFQWTKRKGWDILLKAYLKAFNYDDDVALIIRSYYNRGIEVESRVREFIEELGFDVAKIPRISVISQPLKTEIMPSLYKACQAFVLPSRGEGWGLPYMEAMTMGLPVIGTRFSAQTEFMNDENSYLIDNLGVELVDEEQVTDSALYLGTSWGIPSLEHTAELMREVYDNYPQAQSKGKIARRDILNHWTVENQVQRTVEALLDRKAAEKPEPVAESIPLEIPKLNLKLNPIDSPNVVSRVGERKLKVAMQNRPQTFEAPGGDTVVMQQLKRELEKMGVEIDYHFRLEDLNKYDLVHAFNFALADMVKLYAENAEREGKPLVITPMYEDWGGFIYPSFKLHYLFKDYIEKGQPKDYFPELMESLKRLKPHHRADNSFNVKLANAITPSGDTEAERIKSDYPYARNIIPVYLGCDLPSTEVGPELFIDQTGLKDFVLCVGRVETRKNQLMLLKALEDVEVSVVLVSGGYTYQMPYLELCKKFKRRGQTIILGRLSEEMLVSAYKAAKVHALPSWYELPGMVTIEAAHYDCNVMASPRGTIKDYLGDFGYYAEPDNPDGIRDAVLKALEEPVNPALKEQVRQFTWKAAAETTLKAYQSAIDDHNNIQRQLKAASGLRDSGEMDSALNEYQKVIEIQPYNREALKALSDIYSLNRDSKADKIKKMLAEMAEERRRTCQPHLPNKLEENFPFPEIGEEIAGVEDSADLKNAFELLAEGDYFEAEVIFKNEIERDSRNHKALFGLGKIQFLRSKYDEAAKYFERAAALHRNGDYLLELAAALEKINRCDDALRSLDELKALPGVNGEFDFDLNRIKGHCLLKKGDLDGAEVCYRQALQLEDKSEKPYLGLGSLELLRQNYDQAEEYYRQALELKSDSDKAHLGLALIASEQGQLEKALEHSTKALDLNLENQQAIMVCLKSAHQLGRLEVAEKYLARYASLHPANADILYSLAGVRVGLGDTGGALEAARQVLMFQPDHEPAAELLENLS